MSTRRMEPSVARHWISSYTSHLKVHNFEAIRDLTLWWRLFRWSSPFIQKPNTWPNVSISWQPGWRHWTDWDGARPGTVRTAAVLQDILMLSSNTAPVRTVPARAASQSAQFRPPACQQLDTSGQLLGFCMQGALPLNSRHPQFSSLISSIFRRLHS